MSQRLFDFPKTVFATPVLPAIDHCLLRGGFIEESSSCGRLVALVLVQSKNAPILDKVTIVGGCGLDTGQPFFVRILRPA